MPIARSTVVGATTGVLLLAGAVGFGVGLPKLVDDASVPSLPTQLDDRFVALQAITPEQAGATSAEQAAQIKTFTERAAKSEDETRKILADQYDDAVVRAYIDVPAASGATQTAPAQIAVTIIPGDAGLVNPSGPFVVDESGTHYTLEVIDGSHCAVAWNDPIDQTTGAPTGQKPIGADYRVQCRKEVDGLTYDLYTNGLTPDEVASYVDKVLALTEKG
ncbi:hypothetical protein [Nocardioides daeguensis]|uniref:Lipoprotein n=1 Tax=Nocardioides daeguensis TaxID=908359 RepID=A0ABP6V0X3_9ACTN|nr:hypothetical protein [Nocardioides daeguensis]MBV6726997.1 hypothetical protein [Nocardioides daeguensis]MCR1771600.1 hypothetical protein [Nocardioides daeguensis]